MPNSVKSPFQSNMSLTERALGLCYLPVHILVMPLLISICSAFVLPDLSSKVLNTVYYALGTVYVLVLMRGFLRRDFDTLLDHKLINAVMLVSGYFLYAILSYAAVIGLSFLFSNGVNPNEQAVESMASTDYRALFGIAVFLAPMVEEPLFRGALFGTIREKNRVLAYVVSTLVFSLYHVWQSAAAYGDVKILIYAVQYLPSAIVLAKLYEQSRSIWLPIIFHMMVNAMSLSYM